MKLRSLQRLAEEASSPAYYLKVVDLLGEAGQGDGNKGFSLFADYVDESPYNLRHWMEALEQFLDWLERNNKKATADSIFSYISCCAETARGHSVKAPLADITKEMLESYGCDAAS